MNINSISCAQNSGIGFKGYRGESMTSPIDTAGGDFDDAMDALAAAAKALINAKKAEGAKNEALTKEKVEAKFIAMQNSKPINYDDLYRMGYGISGGDNLLVSCKSDKLDPAIFKGKDTVVIASTIGKDGGCDKLTEYDRQGRPVASIQRMTFSFRKDADYHAAFFKYPNDYTTYSDITLYKNEANPGEMNVSHPKAFLQVGNYI